MKLLERKLSPANMSRQDKQTWRRLLSGALHFAGAFVLSVSTVAGGCCPFAVSLVAVSSKTDFIFSAVGAAIGYLVFGNSTDKARYFASAMIACLGAFAMTAFKLKKEPWLPMVLSFLSVLATGIVMNFKLGLTAGSYALVLGESVLACGGAYFFFRAEACNYRRLKCKAAPVTDFICVIISGALLLMSLSRLTIFGVSPARIIAVFLILATVRFGSARFGVALALCLGFALGLAGKDTMFLLGAYSFSALLAALFSSFASIGCGGAFVLSMGFFAVAANMGQLSLCTFGESVAAALILLVLPESVGDKITSFFENGADIAPDGSLRQSLVVRLRFASSAMASISENVREVREKIDKINDQKGLPADPEKSDLRMVASDQFFSISDMLSDLAFEFDEAECFDAKSAGKIRRLLGEDEIYPKNISVIIDKFDRMRIEIIAESKTSGLNNPALQQKIGRICGRNFEKGRLTYFGSETMLAFSERPNFSLSVGYAQYAAEGQLCGDTIKIINDGRGHMVLIISDGMGRGARAALDGAMGAGLLSKLLSAGFGFDSSLKVVNSALLVKSNEESLATLDCACIDLFTGKCEFFKAGAPRSYIVKNSSVSKCELASMPAGILRGIEFAKRTTILGRGDTVIMMSDGIADVGEEWLEAFIKYSDEMSQQELADAILTFAKKHTDEKHRDDMSVIVAKMLLN